jgi:hypothetical protein
MALERPPENPWTRLVVGICILAAGLVLWLDRIGRIDASDYTPWWPLALVAMGLAHLPKRQWVGAAIWTAIGVYLLAPLAGFRLFSLWRLFGLWPLLITAGGVTLLMQALRSDGKEFNAGAVMGGNERVIVADTFRGGNCVAVMGGCVIDLTRAKIENEATIDVLAFWGGIDLTVPRNWNVTLNVLGLLGGAADTTTRAPEGSPRLIIRGTAIMGGLEVKNAAEEKL